MSSNVFRARHSASSADFGLFRLSSYNFYIAVFENENWRGYKDFRTREVFEFSSPREFFEDEDAGLKGGNFELFVKAVEAMKGQSFDPDLAEKARKLLMLIKDDPKTKSVTVIKKEEDGKKDVEEIKECLTAQQKKEIRQKLKDGISQQELAEEYGVRQQRVSQLTTGSRCKDERDRSSRVQINPRTNPARAAARIRERLGNDFADALKQAL